jgi:hypothetical protein
MQTQIHTEMATLLYTLNQNQTISKNKFHSTLRCRPPINQRGPTATTEVWPSTNTQIIPKETKNSIWRK